MHLETVIQNIMHGCSISRFNLGGTSKLLLEKLRHCDVKLRPPLNVII